MHKEHVTVVDLQKHSGAMRSPFWGHRLDELADRAGNVGVQIHAGSLNSVHLISTWCSGLPALVQAMEGIFEGVPALVGTTAATSKGLLVRSGPEEFLLLESGKADLTALLRSAIPADTGSVTDLGHARCYIQVEGNRCTAMLNKLFALNLRETEFPVGQVRLSGTHHVPSMLHRMSPECFRIIVFTTYAYDQLTSVIDAAREYGVRLTAID